VLDAERQVATGLGKSIGFGGEVERPHRVVWRDRESG